MAGVECAHKDGGRDFDRLRSAHIRIGKWWVGRVGEVGIVAVGDAAVHNADLPLMLSYSTISQVTST